MKRTPSAGAVSIALLHPRSLAIYFLLVPIAILLPFLCYHFELPFVGSTAGRTALPFELLGLFMAIGLVLTGLFELAPRRDGVSIREALPIFLLVATNLHLLLFVSDFTRKTDDFKAPELAAQDLVAGGDPYAPALAYGAGEDINISYTWPPLTAKVLATLYRGAHGITSRLGQRVPPELLWNGIFYLYQALQLVLVFVLYLLVHRAVRLAGLEEWWASALVCFVFVFNVPLIRTLRFNQVNLWVLAATLTAALLIEKYPATAGVFLAIGIHIKLYPAVLLLPLLLMKKWRVLVAALASFVLIAGVLADFGRDWRIWWQYGRVLQAMPFTPPTFRDNSIHSVLYNTLRFSGISAVWSGAPAAAVFLMRLIGLGFVSYFTYRFVARERSFSELESVGEGADRQWLRFARLAGHVCDGFALMLLLSPLVWEHHYVFALPVIVWAILTRGSERPWLVSSAAALILLVPTYDLFPLSLNRLLGLLLLVWLISPLLRARSGLSTSTGQSQLC